MSPGALAILRAEPKIEVLSGYLMSVAEQQWRPALKRLQKPDPQSLEDVREALNCHTLAPEYFGPHLLGIKRRTLSFPAIVPLVSFL